MEDILAKLSFEFATSVVLTCDEVKNRPVLKTQLIKSATSIGANIREANYGYSDADFLSKMQIALKELRKRILVEIIGKHHGINSGMHSSAVETMWKYTFQTDTINQNGKSQIRYIR